MLLILYSGNVIEFLEIKPGFPGGSDGKESSCNVGDMGSIPGLGRFSGAGVQPRCIQGIRSGDGVGKERLIYLLI